MQNGNKAKKKNGVKRGASAGRRVRKPFFEYGKSRWTGRKKVHRTVKDRLFRFLFEMDREALLQLYNALNGTSYTDAAELQIVTIENVIYVVMKNDIAFVLAGTLNLYEHQSTYNPNMPVRFLIYLAEEYQKLIEQMGMSLYGTTQISLPTPQCVVFYNGEKGASDEEILKLSDAFIDKEQKSDIELTVRMLNINYGHNSKLLEQCSVLNEYAQFVDVSRKYIADGLNAQEAFNEAIDYCMNHGILHEVFKNYRAEVLGMLLEEFDVDKYERTIRMEGREEGIEEGIEQLSGLTTILLEQNRMQDLKRAMKDKKYRERLFREFGL